MKPIQILKILKSRNPMKAELTILVGLPASGKSSFLEDCTSKMVVVCPDNIRKEVFGVEFNKDVEGMVWFLTRSMIKMLLLQDKTVILDATNISVSRRKEWIDLGHECNAQVSAIHFDTPYETCVERNKARSRVVPDNVMERMRDEFEVPETDEGFDRVDKMF